MHVKMYNTHYFIISTVIWCIHNFKIEYYWFTICTNKDGMLLRKRLCLFVAQPTFGPILRVMGTIVFGIYIYMMLAFQYQYYTVCYNFQN